MCGTYNALEGPYLTWTQFIYPTKFIRNDTLRKTVKIFFILSNFGVWTSLIRTTFERMNEYFNGAMLAGERADPTVTYRHK